MTPQLVSMLYVLNTFRRESHTCRLLMKQRDLACVFIVRMTGLSF